MIQITRINHVSLLVADTQRALGFYHDTLGLAINTQRPELAFAGAWLDVGGNQQIHLLELASDGGVPRAAAHGGRDRHLAMEVDSLEAVMHALDEAGIDYTLSRSGRRALFCRDPDGNAVELIEA